MNNIEKQINKNNAINYIEKQFYSVLPYKHEEKDFLVNLKIQSTNGATNWLSIGLDDLKQIENIIFNSYLKRAQV